MSQDVYKRQLFDPHDPKQLAETIARTAARASLPEHEAEYAGNMEQGIANIDVYKRQD